MKYFYTKTSYAYMYHIDNLDMHEHYMYCSCTAMLV